MLERASIPATWDVDSVSVPSVSVPRVDVFMDFLSTIPDNIVLELAETSDFDPDDATPLPPVPPPLPIPDVAMPRYRLGTFLVDGVLVGVVTVPLYQVLPSPIGAWVTGVIGAAYGIVMVHALGQTVGNMATRTRVVSLRHRSRPSWRAAVIRWLVPSVTLFLDWLPGGAWIGFAWTIAVYIPILFGPEYRGLHDRAAQVVVLDNRWSVRPE